MRFVVLGDIGRRHLYHVGDEAMTDVAITELSSRGATGVTLVCTDPSEAARLYGLPAVARVGFGPRWSREEMQERVDEITKDPQRVPELAAAVSEADAVLIAGGGNMTSTFSHHIYERLVLTRLAKAFGRPLLITSQTIGPILHPTDRALVTEILQSAAIVGARDDDTYALARRLAPGTNIWRTSDDAILLQHSPDAAEWAEQYREAGSRFIVGSFTSDSGSSGMDRHRYLDLLTGTLDRLAEGHDAEVLLIPHAGSLDGPVQKLDELSDLALTERSASGRLRAIPTTTARNCLALMDGALLSLSTRYHPVVFAPPLLVPTLGISLSAYSSTRMTGALRPWGMSDAVVAGTAWPTVHDAAAELIDRREEVRTWLGEARPGLVQAQQVWWDAVVSGATSSSPVQGETVQAPTFIFHGGWVDTNGVAREALDGIDRIRTEAAWQGEELALANSETTRLREELSSTRRHLDLTRARLDREKSRKVVRFADGLGSLARRICVSRTKDSPAPHAHEQRTLSVVLPVYNVEQYLKECLSSITGQSLKDLEIIVIDDGSTDASAEVAQGFADRDDRIRFIRQENRGLGAVRNAGAQIATGKYLTFVDSDDIVPPGTFSDLVGSLERSGSDLALGGVRRIRPDGSEFTPGWVRSLHSRDRSTTLADDPELLRNFYTWNKVFSARFWRTHGFRFREGVLFEDQPVITQAFHQADSIDILARTAYLWRIREDDSSLTGRMYTVPDIESRHEATRLTARALAQLGSPNHVYNAWLWTLAQFHFPNYLEHTVDEGSAYSSVLAMVREFLTVDHLSDLQGVSAAKKALLYTALTGSRKDVSTLLDAGRATSDFSLTSDGPTRILAPPPVDQAPLWVTEVSAAEQELIAALDSHDWDDQGVLHLTGRVGVAQAPTTCANGLTLLLTGGDHRVELPVTTDLRDYSVLPREYGLAQWLAFSSTVDLPSVIDEHPGLAAVDMSLCFELSLDQHRHSGRFNRLPSTESVRGSALPAPGETVMATWTRAHGLSLKVHRRPVTGSKVSMSGTQLSLTVHSHNLDLDPVFLLAGAAGRPEHRRILHRAEDGAYGGTIDLSWLEAGDTARIAVLDDTGRRRNVHVPGVRNRSGTFLTQTAPGAGLVVKRS